MWSFIFSPFFSYFDRFGVNVSVLVAVIKAYHGFILYSDLKISHFYSRPNPPKEPALLKA